VRFIVRPTFKALPAFIRNFSSQGIGLIVMRPVEPGKMLALQLRKNQAGVSDILTAHVKHVRPLPNSCWYAGCRLSRALTRHERLALGDSCADGDVFWTAADQ
jgi:hypothetical protein